MSDRELLEAAAKVAGIKINGQWSNAERMYANTDQDWWNPLTDDGDALRLAVKLGIDVQLYRLKSEVRPHDRGVATLVDRLGRRFAEDGDKDPYAATRRAIVRAAAALSEKP